MTVSVQREALADALRLCSVVESKLRADKIGTLFEASKGVFTITADNYAICCCVEVPGATIKGEGILVLPAGRLLHLLSSATAAEVTITANEQSAEVVCGDVSCQLTGLPVSDFPQRPAWPVVASFEVPNIRTVLTWLSAVVSGDNYNPNNEGIHVIGRGEMLRIEALDGRQLHSVECESSAVVNAIAPPGLIKFVKAFEVDGGCTIEISECSISLRTERILICAQRLAGQFSDTSSVIPEPSDKLLTLPKAALESALSAAGAVFEKSVGGPSAVNFSVKSAVTTISTDRCTPGLVETVIAASNPFEINFRIDALRLLASLKHIDADEVQLQCDDPPRSVCIRHGAFLAVIALMHKPSQ